MSQGVLRLNLGCGEFRAKGWMNVDMVRTETIQPDVVADMSNLPREMPDVDAVYCGHVLEHVPEAELVDVLRKIQLRMAPGAPIAAVGPDLDRARALHAAGRLDDATFAECHAGAGDKAWSGDYHYWSCTEAGLVAALEGAGFRNVRAVPLESRELDAFPVVSRAPWQCAVLAEAPSRFIRRKVGPNVQ